MTPAIFPEPDIGGDRFSCNDATADALSVAQLRDEFARWLRRGAGMDETRMCDTVLAVNEALANAAEFAYDDGRAGLLNLEAVRDVRRGTITVTVSDQGHWRETNSLHLMRSRGRGISLMRLRMRTGKPESAWGLLREPQFFVVGRTRPRRE